MAGRRFFDPGGGRCAWPGSEREVSPRTQRFAKWPAICSFALGKAGQIAYHLLAQARGGATTMGRHHDVLPVLILVLVMGTALADILHADAAADAAGSRTVEPTTHRHLPNLTRTRQDRARTKL